jgi:hypothetical protein
MKQIAVARVATRAWSAPSLGLLPALCDGTHVFHAWLGIGRIRGVSELSGWMNFLADRASRIHVRRACMAAVLRAMYVWMQCGYRASTHGALAHRPTDL